jgi:hypothetical protein
LRRRAVGVIEERLEALGLRLPEPFVQAGREYNFRVVKVHGGLGYVAGHGPFDGATPLVRGRLGDDLTVEQGYEAARLTALAILPR